MRQAAPLSPGGPAGRAGEGRARELGVLYAVAATLNHAADVRQALARTLALVAELLGLDTGWVWLLDPDTSQFYSAAVQHLPPYLQEPVRMTGGWCECIGAFQAGDLTPKNVDVIECSRLLPAVRAQDTTMTRGLRYHASVPLYFRDKPLGIMNLAGPAWRKLTQEELRLLSTIGAQVGIAIERARLAEESARLARAEERAHLAREIHDTLAQDLTAIALHVEGALRTLEADPPKARARLEQALTTARGGLDEARRSVLDLRAALAGRPLAEALAALTRHFTSETGVRVHLRTSTSPSAAGEIPRLPLRIEAELFRIAQEALNNVRRHARANEVTLTLRVTPLSVLLSVRDNGQGFRPPASGSRERHGIVGMRERARLLGGKLRLTGRPGQGATVVASIPLPAPAPDPAPATDAIPPDGPGSAFVKDARP